MTTFPCPRCGSELPQSQLDGEACPRCLLELALADQDDTSTELAPGRPAEHLRKRRIGPYRLLSRLGEGGMGEVFLAEQDAPLRRRVALKLIKPGLGSPQAIARFESERQALALMSHPSIARVLDAGTTEEGTPFFVMEYVQGEPITAYCDRHHLTMADRIALFREVCAGVQHAHQRGILHRDLKPSNILVEGIDGAPRPRVIDFGLAKALSQRLTERTLFTERGQILGTPEYMSPEQAAGEGFDIDTRTDVYSLGVILYELLSGSLPHDPDRLKEAGWLGMMRILREEEPKKPSTRVSTLNDETAASVAASRETTRQELQRTLEGDLDWIVLKTLDRERERRYANVSDLAADLERYLSDQPVAAGPPSAWYRATKFVKRHRVGITSASLLVILLLVSLVLALQQLTLTRRQRAEAQTRLEAERHVSQLALALGAEIALRPTARSSDPTGGKTPDAVTEFRARIETTSPEVRRVALVAAAAVLQDHDLEAAAADFLRQALLLHESDPDTPPLVLAQTLQLLALLDGDAPDALPQLERSLRVYRSRLGEQHPLSVDAYCQTVAMRYSKALGGSFGRAPNDSPPARAFERESQRCLDSTADLGPAADRLLARRLAQFGFFLQFTPAGPPAARRHLARAVEILRSLDPASPWQLAEALEFLGALDGPRGNPQSAVEVLREACELREQSAGARARETAVCLLNLGAHLISSGERAEGISTREKALATLNELDPEYRWPHKYPPTETSWLLRFDGAEDPFREDVRRVFARVRAEGIPSP